MKPAWMREEKFMWLDEVKEGKLIIPNTFRRNLRDGTRVKVYVEKIDKDC